MAKRGRLELGDNILRTISQLIVQILDTLCFEPPLRGGGLGTTYDVYLKLIGKREVDFLLVLIFFRYVLRLRRYW